MDRNRRQFRKEVRCWDAIVVSKRLALGAAADRECVKSRDTSLKDYIVPSSFSVRPLGLQYEIEGPSQRQVPQSKNPNFSNNGPLDIRRQTSDRSVPLCQSAFQTSENPPWATA